MKKSKEIKDILKTGISFKGIYFIALIKKNNLNYPRFAFVVSKKFSKKAVERNRVKRILREALRLVLPKMKNFSYDIVLVPKKNLLKKKMSDLNKDIKALIEFLRELNEKNFN
ncbi:ribonuclease P protein component [Hydrogenothermus marinus]|nr:ribonuclease P protein component [Hydrogenothermus marinus]